MPTKETVVALLKAYCARGEITRTEAGKLLGGLNRNQVARLCDDHDIKPWPRITKGVMRARKCQVPLRLPRQGENPATHSFLCGNERDLGNKLCCIVHRSGTWSIPNK